MNIRIKSLPPGEAPEEVRRAWIGLEMPLPARFSGRSRGWGFGVLSGPKTRLGLWWDTWRGRARREDGYVVEARVAVDLLAARAPEAAEWWRKHAAHVIAPGRCFVFAAECCEELPEEGRPKVRTARDDFR